MSQLSLGPVTTNDADLESTAALLREVFPDATHFTDDVIRWQYRDNPHGEVVGFNARTAEGRLAAHYATIPVRALVDGESQRGLLSLNTATHPDHRGTGLFTTLADATYQAGADRGFKFVIGVANANSTPGFIRKLGFQLVSPLRVVYGIGPLPRVRPSTPCEFEPEWSVIAMNWRLRHPTNVYSVTRNGSANLVVSAQSKVGGRYVLGEFDGSLFGPLDAEARRAPLCKIWMGLRPPQPKRGLRAYVNIPMRFRPSPLNFIFKDLVEPGRQLDPDSVFFQAIDFDVV